MKIPTAQNSIARTLYVICLLPVLKEAPMFAKKSEDILIFLVRIVCLKVACFRLGYINIAHV